MERPVEMNTVSQILEKLRLKGLDNEIKMTDHGKMQGVGLNKIYKPEDLLLSKPIVLKGIQIRAIAQFFISWKIKTIR